ncbi:MAG TPA: DMT family transporter [Alphaproteobacteria bacterium]|nr:DMT family transporter [Alphaproteobacteria bacterium]
MIRKSAILLTRRNVARFPFARTIMAQHDLSRRDAILLLAAVVFAWGGNWPVTKLILLSLPPLWTTALRSAIGTLILLALAAGQGRLIRPRRGDVPVILSIGLLHMVGFSALVSTGLQFVPAGRSIVLGYTTPLWVAPGARLLLKEPLTARRWLGVAIGLSGLMVMFNPASFDWGDQGAIVGNGLLLLAALCWAASILYVRAHRWVSPPFELCFWEALLATAVLVPLAFVVEGVPDIPWRGSLLFLLLYGGAFGIALPYWAITLVNRSLPAAATSLGLLAVPPMGVACSALALGEPIGLTLLAAMVLIIGGIAIGTNLPGAGAPEDGTA